MRRTASSFSAMCLLYVTFRVICCENVQAARAVFFFSSWVCVLRNLTRCGVVIAAAVLSCGSANDLPWCSKFCFDGWRNCLSKWLTCFLWSDRLECAFAHIGSFHHASNLLRCRFALRRF